MCQRFPNFAGNPKEAKMERERLIEKRNNRNVSIWLYVGVFMLMIQILLGGITRLTESGLSITEWKPITGMLPPLNEVEWQQEFDKYKGIDQFKYIHSDFSIADFKMIFFWEWFHRAWARLMGVVFLVGFFYFLIRKQLKKEMVIPFVILFVLGIIQGAIGWIMVMSGLVPEKLFVGHIELATHFMAALLLLAYTFWFALDTSVPKNQLLYRSSLKKWLWIPMGVLFIQLIYGAFMAGLHAAVVAPTWPTINGQWIPKYMNDLKPVLHNLTDNKITVQFIHRLLAYILFALIIVWGFKVKGIRENSLFNRVKYLPVILVVLQVVLGIFTVTLSPYGNYLVWFGVTHQLVAMLLLMSLVLMIYLVRKSERAV